MKNIFKYIKSVSLPHWGVSFGVMQCGACYKYIDL